uniref:DNA-directed RNA polymerases I, II, and III subunit RPABC1 n=2 Tax=Lotharella globosa TaxID=91324 RepID=A0A6U3AN53_9EUKA|mmetsp:Transcript_15935/g.32370  ORF Transcript_15935/g.32370 Transcript_15935/m.32370 type:complete len:204 (+) Transcript_15935:58-669(+)
MENDELEKLFRVRKTVLEMLMARGYMVPDDDKNMELKEFKDKFRGSARDILKVFAYKDRDDPASRIFVFWNDDKKLNRQSLTSYEQRMTHHKVTRAIIVVQNQITTVAKTVIENYNKFRIEVFMEGELLVNITKHRYVPTHQVLTEKEKQALLTKYHLKETQLPRMQLSDPISRFYGLDRGQVVKIYRPSETAGKYVTYRVVL